MYALRHRAVYGSALFAGSSSSSSSWSFSSRSASPLRVVRSLPSYRRSYVTRWHSISGTTSLRAAHAEQVPDGSTDRRRRRTVAYYTVSKNGPLCHCPYLRQTITDFQNAFTGTFCIQFAITRLLNIPPHVKCVATLPCEI